MKFLTCYYDDRDNSGNAWDKAIQSATAGMTQEERRGCQIICLPEAWRKKAKYQHEQFQIAGVK